MKRLCLLVAMAIMIAVGLSGCVVVLQPDVVVSGYWGPRYSYSYPYGGGYYPRYDGYGSHHGAHTHCDYSGGCWSHAHPHGEGAYGHHHR